MRTANRVVVITAALAALTVPALPAFADGAPTTTNFGQHVSACAQAMGGFTGDLNPGMHRGAAGWDGGTCQ